MRLQYILHHKSSNMLQLNICHRRFSGEYEAVAVWFSFVTVAPSTELLGPWHPQSLLVFVFKEVLRVSMLAARGVICTLQLCCVQKPNKLLHFQNGIQKMQT